MSRSPQGVKRCCTCDDLKPLSEFHNRKESIDGHRNDCKECRKTGRTRDYDASTKRCSGCDRRLPKTEEYFRPTTKTKWGFNTKCRECVREYGRTRHYKERYGLSIKEVEDIKELKSQCCEICGDDENRLVVDHCHTSGEVRGVLCDSCNLGLGSFRESKENLISAISYLNYRG